MRIVIIHLVLLPAVARMKSVVTKTHHKAAKSPHKEATRTIQRKRNDILMFPPNLLREGKPPRCPVMMTLKVLVQANLLVVLGVNLQVAAVVLVVVAAKVVVLSPKSRSELLWSPKMMESRTVC